MPDLIREAQFPTISDVKFKNQSFKRSTQNRVAVLLVGGCFMSTE